MIDFFQTSIYQTDVQMTWLQCFFFSVFFMSFETMCCAGALNNYCWNIDLRDKKENPLEHLSLALEKFNNFKFTTDCCKIFEIY